MAYDIDTCVEDVRRVLNDDTENVWTNTTIKYYINNAISIIKNTVPEYFTTLVKVTTGDILIDSVYEELLVLFATARCLEQDEQDYRAAKQMNEFESRRSEMEEKIYSSSAYATIIATADQEYVIDEQELYEEYDDVIAPLDP